MIQPTWYPAPLTPAELAAAVHATDLAGSVEAAAWDDVWADALTEDDRRAWR